MARQWGLDFNNSLGFWRKLKLPGTLLRLFSNACRDLRRCLSDLLIFDILFKAITFAILTPIVGWLFRQFVATSGNAAVGNFDIARFLLSPLGLGMSIVIAGLFCTVLFGELAGLMYIGFGAAQGLRFTFADALRFIKGRVARILGASYLVLLILLAAALPFVVAALGTADYFLSQHDINYYLEARPREFVAAILVGVVLASLAVLVLALVIVRLIFVLPQVLFQQNPVRSAFRDSRRLTKGNSGYIVTAILAWLLGTSLASLLLNSFVYFTGTLMVSASGERVGLLLVSLGIIAAVDLIVNLALAFLGSALGCLLIARMYRECGLSRGMNLNLAADWAPSLDAEPRRRLPRKVPLAVSAIMIVFAAFLAYELLESLGLDDHVEISAHRGASLVAPENTLSAVRQAIVDGATYVEVDVQRTADGVVILSHDADLMRLSRKPLIISESTYEELRAVDVGRLFSTEFTGERLPTLEEVIEASRGKAKLIVELKSYRGDSDQLVADVVQMFRSHDLFSDAVIMSLEYSEVQQVERLDPMITTGFVASAALGNISKLNVDFLAVSKAMATNTFVATAHSQGKQIYVWTIDDPGEMSTMIDRGVDNIITNDPRALVGVLEERAELGNAERILLRFKSLFVLQESARQDGNDVSILPRRLLALPRFSGSLNDLLFVFPTSTSGRTSFE